MRQNGRIRSDFDHIVFSGHNSSQYTQILNRELFVKVRP